MWNTPDNLSELSRPRPLISRTTLLILALILLGMGLGSRIPHDWAPSCFTFGWFGVAAYVALELTTIRRVNQYCEARHEATDRILCKRLHHLLDGGSEPDLPCDPAADRGEAAPTSNVVQTAESG